MVKTAVMRNFRGIDHIPISFDRTANVIVGPNAIGKTTLLEAIRLAKATLAPRVPEETQQVLMSLGAIIPQNPTRFNYAALTGDPARPVEINTTFALTDDEVQSLDGLIPQLATSMVRAGMGSAIAQGPVALVQFLSSPFGQQALTAATIQIGRDLPGVKAASSIALNLRIDAASATIRGEKQLDQILLSVFENQLPAHQAIFSYFPADRALPAGEVQIQIGGPDIAQQLQSHNATPQTKFTRLKPTIINNFLLNEAARKKLQDNFTRIFTSVLKDRTLTEISINEFGFVSIKITESSTGRVFDIDGMSSGEKGLSPYPASTGSATVTGIRRFRVAPAAIPPAVSWS